MNDPDHPLVTALRTAARSLTGTSFSDLDTTLSDLVRAGAKTVPHADGSGISRTERGTVRSSYATDDTVYQLDQLQAEMGQGPCITAADDPPASGIVLAHDLAGADTGRWPSFAPRAVAAGYRSIMSVQLSLAGRRRSALNFYAHTPNVFDLSAQLTAGLFGVQAAMLLYGADHAAHLDRALATRDRIGQAKGVLMERFAVSDEDAFHMLVTTSQDTNMKLIDVAAWLVGDAGTREPRPGT